MHLSRGRLNSYPCSWIDVLKESSGVSGQYVSIYVPFFIVVKGGEGSFEIMGESCCEIIFFSLVLMTISLLVLPSMPKGEMRLYGCH